MNRCLVILTPAFPGSEAPEFIVQSQQLLVKTLKQEYPWLEIIVLSLLYPQRTDTYDWRGARVWPFNGMKYRKWKRPFLWWRAWKTLKQVRRKYKIEGMLSFWCGESAMIGKYFSRRRGIKHFIWICGQDARQANKWVRKIRPEKDELVAMSHFLADEFHRNHGIRPAFIIPNAIDISEFTPGDNRKEKRIDILGVGSLIPQKNYRLFVRLVGELKKDFPAIRSCLCGDGEEKEKLQALIDQLGLQNNLELMGSLSHEKIIGHMQSSRVFLHPSLYEGASTVCLEALYAGATVISFCRSEEKEVPNWNIVENEDEMLGHLRSVLSLPAWHNPVLLHTMTDSAKTFMNLFGLR